AADGLRDRPGRTVARLGRAAGAYPARGGQAGGRGLPGRRPGSAGRDPGARLRRAAGHPAATQAAAGQRAGHGIRDRKVSVDLTEAYRECERITWTQARNFAYGIRLLPPAKRQGLAVIYAFARRIDDIGDGTLPPEQKIADLEQARESVLTINEAKDTDDPVLLALADTARNFPIPLPAF